MKGIVLAAILVVAVPAVAAAQKTGHHWGEIYLFAGSAGSDPDAQVGAGGKLSLFRGLGVGGELSYAGPWLFEQEGLAMGSLDLSYQFHPVGKKGNVEPFVVAGPQICTGHGQSFGATFGGGVNIWSSARAALRVEVRGNVADERITPAVRESFVSFRVGLTFR